MAPGALVWWQYLSGSFSSNTFRLVWSRMLRMVMKQPKSSFFARNAAIMVRTNGTDRMALDEQSQCEEVAQARRSARAFASHERRVNAEETDATTRPDEQAWCRISLKLQFAFEALTISLSRHTLVCIAEAKRSAHAAALVNALSSHSGADKLDQKCQRYVSDLCQPLQVALFP
jgi:hypothetical protein